MIVVNPELAGNVPLLLVAVAAGMYWLGGRRQRRFAAPRPWRTGAFAAALVATVLALGEPLDGLADDWFWAHMLEHVILLVVVAPLLVLAAPWMRLWRAFPLSFRRPVARSLALARWTLPLRGLAHVLGHPWVAFLAVNVDVYVWHIPGAYDLTLHSEAIHDLEHLTFVLFSVIAWAQVADSPPFHSRLDEPRRLAFSFGCMVAGWLLAMLLAFSTAPLYAYGDRPHPAGGLSALADQEMGGGIMWVIASLPWSIALLLLVYRWVGRHGGDKPPAAVPAPPAARPDPPVPAASPPIPSARS